MNKKTNDPKVTYTIVLHRNVAAKVDALAKADSRSRSNMVEVLLDCALRVYEQERQVSATA